MILYSHFVWGKVIIAATTRDCGNPWASRAGMIEWMMIVAKAARLVEENFSSWAWLAACCCVVCLECWMIVSAAGLTVHRTLLSLLTAHLASNFVFDRQKIFFVKWWWRFFAGVFISSLELKYHRHRTRWTVGCVVFTSKVHVSAERHLTDIYDYVRALNISIERAGYP